MRYLFARSLIAVSFALSAQVAFAQTASPFGKTPLPTNSDVQAALVPPAKSPAPAKLAAQNSTDQVLKTVVVRKHSDLPAGWKKMRADLTAALEGDSQLTPRQAVQPILNGYAHHTRTKAKYSPAGEFSAAISALTGSKVLSATWGSGYAISYRLATPIVLSSQSRATLLNSLYANKDVEMVDLEFLPTPVTPSIIKLKDQKSLAKMEPNLIGKPKKILGFDDPPNDPLFMDQWEMWGPDSANPNFSFGGSNAFAAWKITKGKPSVRAALVDGGFVLHEDLTGQWAHDVCAFNYGNANDLLNDCLSGNDNLVETHGSLVASTLAAAIDNGMGGVGIAPLSKIYGISELGRADAIRYSAGIDIPNIPLISLPAKVVSSSFTPYGEYGCSSSTQDAIDEAYAMGTLFVQAAGNNNGTTPIAVGICRRVINVGAINRYGNLHNPVFSRGAWISIAAPGLAMTTVRPVTGYPHEYHVRSAGGTSFSAPMVAGTIALMHSANPNLTAAQARSYLLSSTRPFRSTLPVPDPDPTIGHQACSNVICGTGMLDAKLAVQMAKEGRAPVASAQLRHNLGKGELNGQASYSPIGARLAYQWRQLSGQPVVIKNANKNFANFNWPANLGADALFQLTVTDTTMGITNIATTHTLHPRDDIPPGAFVPVISTSPLWPRANDLVTLNGSLSINRISPTTIYEWAINRGTFVGSRTAPITTINFPADASSIFVTLTIKDPLSNAISSTSEQIRGILYKPVNLVLKSNPNRPRLGASITLDGSASYADQGGVVGVNWYQGTRLISNINDTNAQVTLPSSLPVGSTSFKYTAIGGIINGDPDIDASAYKDFIIHPNLQQIDSNCYTHFAVIQPPRTPRPMLIQCRVIIKDDLMRKTGLMQIVNGRNIKIDSASNYLDPYTTVHFVTVPSVFVPSQNAINNVPPVRLVAFPLDAPNEVSAEYSFR